MDTWIRGVWIKGGDGKGGWLLDAVKFYILRIEGFRLTGIVEDFSMRWMGKKYV